MKCAILAMFIRLFQLRLPFSQNLMSLFCWLACMLVKIWICASHTHTCDVLMYENSYKTDYEIPNWIHKSCSCSKLKFWIFQRKSNMHLNKHILAERILNKPNYYKIIFDSSAHTNAEIAWVSFWFCCSCEQVCVSRCVSFSCENIHIFTVICSGVRNF